MSSMAGFEIAQLNVGRAVGAMDGAEMADFVARLDEINALAEASPGFVWRLQGDNGNATALHYTDDPRFIVNLSVWRSIDELWAFAYASTHKELFRRRFEWFERSATPTMVLWWQLAAASSANTVRRRWRRRYDAGESGPSGDRSARRRTDALCAPVTRSHASSASSSRARPTVIPTVGT